MRPVGPHRSRPSRRGLRRIVGVVVLAAAGGLALAPGTLAGVAGLARRRGVPLQRRLATLHYDVGPIDGSFGAKTYHGVVAFQKVNGLARDEIVGPRTWAALAHPVIRGPDAGCRPPPWRST